MIIVQQMLLINLNRLAFIILVACNYLKINEEKIKFQSERYETNLRELIKNSFWNFKSSSVKRFQMNAIRPC